MNPIFNWWGRESTAPGFKFNEFTGTYIKINYDNAYPSNNSVEEKLKKLIELINEILEELRKREAR